MTIDQEFHQFLANVYKGATLGSDQWSQLRGAFFAGTIVLFQKLREDGHTDDEMLRMLEGVDRDIEMFKAEMILEAAKETIRRQNAREPNPRDDGATTATTAQVDHGEG